MERQGRGEYMVRQYSDDDEKEKDKEKNMQIHKVY